MSWLPPSGRGSKSRSWNFAASGLHVWIVAAVQLGSFARSFDGGDREHPRTELALRESANGICAAGVEPFARMQHRACVRCVGEPTAWRVLRSALTYPARSDAASTLLSAERDVQRGVASGTIVTEIRSGVCGRMLEIELAAESVARLERIVAVVDLDRERER